MIKVSCGILCYKNTSDGKKILIVKKACSHAYIEFVIATKTPSGSTLSGWFNNMSAEDKDMIASMRYDFMYYRAFKKMPTQAMIDKFHAVYDGIDILAIMSKSVRRVDLWELPKGRKHDKESTLECAIRELREETGLNYGEYMIVSDGTFRTKKKDAGKKYVCRYYVAELLAHSRFVGIDSMRIQYGKCYNEISDNRWVTMSELAEINGELHEMVKKTFRFLRNQARLPKPGVGSHMRE